MQVRLLLPEGERKELDILVGKLSAGGGGAGGGRGGAGADMEAMAREHWNEDKASFMARGMLWTTPPYPAC